VTNEELALLVQEGSAAALEQLTQQNNGLMRRLAYRLFMTCGGTGNNVGMEYVDALQIAFLGLHGAARAYDPAKGFKFSAYLWRQTQRAYNDIYRRQEKDPLNSADSTDRIICEGSEDIALSDTLPDEGAAAAFEDCEETLWAKQAGDDLVTAFEALPSEQADAIRAFYVYRLPVHKIARMQGLTRPKTHEAIRLGLEELACSPALTAYRAEFITNRAMRGTGIKSFRNRQGSAPEILVEQADDIFSMLLM